MAENRHPNENDSSLEKEIQGIFRKVENEVPDPSPFLKTRVLALYRERVKSRRGLLFWRLATFSGVGFGMAAIAFLLIVRGPLSSSSTGLPDTQFKALVGQPMAIQLKPAGVGMSSNDAFRRVEVLLPDGVRFYSLKYPQISKWKQISLEREKLAEKAKFPVIIRSDTAGTKTIKVRFVNVEGQILKEQNLETYFYSRVG
ncbi:hypothetical protein GWN26_00270 [Candidatus Saccharibacteria bacterium]|nr:hypothetical protein [Candidatus Saccharibacteria bacterium]NIV03100.1 hypothetical protein [Calditrichia bacterium]NIV71210.1 hypothetical protein [Calditrichia bacterium]NIV97656.1 hypothetical protein [Candidatus Saccharibacteria bacterium]NIW77962.1 hypothetical protein [Calditrichia bacterium]